MIDNRAIFNISYGLFVLVARQGDKDNACIINVAQQVTSDPLQLMICVNKQNLTHDMILRTLTFNLCPLSEEATMKPFQHFGFQSGRDVNKFAECETELRTENGLRYLPKFINSVISCVVTKSIDLGTHTMFIPMPTTSSISSPSPPLRPPQAARRNGSAKFAATSMKATSSPPTSSAPGASTPPATSSRWNKIILPDKKIVVSLQSIIETNKLK